MGIDIIEAGGVDGEKNSGASTDLFPAGATEYTKIPNHHITDIQEQQGIISFDFMGGEDAKEVAFNYARAVYLSADSDDADCDTWELDLVQYNTMIMMNMRIKTLNYVLLMKLNQLKIIKRG